MQIPVRWRIRTLLLAILLVGLCLGVVALRRRAVQQQKIAQEYAEWQTKISEMLTLLDTTIKRNDDMVTMAEQHKRVFPNSDNGRLAAYSVKLKHRLEVR